MRQSPRIYITLADQSRHPLLGEVPKRPPVLNLMDMLSGPAVPR